MNELTFRVNIADIKEELADFPGTFESWATKLATTSNAVSRTKLDLSLALAKKEIHIRQNPLNYGFPKLTEDTVKACLAADKDVNELERKLVDSEAEVRVLRAIVDSLEVKRSSLKYLCELATSGFVNLAPITGV